MYALHFGVYPKLAHQGAEIDGHGDPQDEREILLDTTAPTVYISGSWACWGPADQDTDGDHSLHVVAYAPHLRPDRLLALRHRLSGLLHPESRLLDYAVVTTAEDWSEQVAVVTFIGQPEVSIWPNNSAMST